MAALPMTLPRAWAKFANARRRAVRLARHGRLTLTDDERAAMAYENQAAGRVAVLLAEAGQDPREIEGHTLLSAETLIAMSGASRDRRAAAQAVLRTFAGQ